MTKVSNPSDRTDPSVEIRIDADILMYETSPGCYRVAFGPPRHVAERDLAADHGRSKGCQCGCTATTSAAACALPDDEGASDAYWLRLLTTKEASEVLSISAETLKDWRSKRAVHSPPAIRLGSTVRYRRIDLLRWIQDRAVSPADGPIGRALSAAEPT